MPSPARTPTCARGRGNSSGKVGTALIVTFGVVRVVLVLLLLVLLVLVEILVVLVVEIVVVEVIVVVVRFLFGVVLVLVEILLVPVVVVRVVRVLLVIDTSVLPRLHTSSVRWTRPKTMLDGQCVSRNAGSARL